MGAEQRGHGPLNILEDPQTKTFIGRTHVHTLPLNPLSHDCVGLYVFVCYLCMLFLMKSFLYVS